MTTALGRAMVLASALFFYMATVCIRWSRENFAEISAEEFVVARFVLGTLVMWFVVLNPFSFGKKSSTSKEPFQPKNYLMLFARAISNLGAVYCLYRCIESRTVAEANILNMCYPVYVTLASVFIFKSGNYRMLCLSLVAFVGVYLLVANSSGAAGQAVANDFPSTGTIWGIVSGLLAAFSIICLRYARLENSANEVMTVVFTVSLIASLLMFWPKLGWPNNLQLYYLFLSALFGTVAQYLITAGFAFVSASEGSVISISRILIAAILGSILTSDPALTGWGIVGALIIFLVNVFIVLEKGRSTQKI